MKAVWKYIDALLDIVYPPVCLGCRKLGRKYICLDCLNKIEPVKSPFCNICGHTLKGASCNNCESRDVAFSKARAAGNYAGVLRELIHEFKYRGARCLADDLSKLMYDYAKDRSDIDLASIDCLIPVPIHSIRKRIRGYNQSELLADGISSLSGIPSFTDVMRRIVYTNPQVDLSREKRMKNMKQAFAIVSSCKIKDKKLLLIDDVSTTSSTLHECSSMLLNHGAREVNALCLAFDE